jgi:predicted amidohydrolase
VDPLFKIALCQTRVVDNKKINVENAYEKICTSADNGARIVALPEMFNCPYLGKYFSDYAEDQDGSTVRMLREVSREKGIYVVGGSIPEMDGGKIYNTSFVTDPDGEIIARHRKAHLFDVDIEDGIRFMESDYLSAGDDFTVFDTPYGKAGVCICYDIRFPEIIRAMVLKGAQMVFVPAVFNMTTGPVHWEILFRSRAVDNQIYMLGISPSRDYDGVSTAYGHSIIVDPWGKVICEAGEKEEIIYGEIDMDYEGRIRRQLPLLKHRRPGIYI